jgi:hypothetical protein
MLGKELKSAERASVSGAAFSLVILFYLLWAVLAATSVFASWWIYEHTETDMRDKISECIPLDLPIEFFERGGDQGLTNFATRTVDERIFSSLNKIIERKGPPQNAKEFAMHAALQAALAAFRPAITQQVNASIALLVQDAKRAIAPMRALILEADHQTIQVVNTIFDVASYVAIGNFVVSLLMIFLILVLVLVGMRPQTHRLAQIVRMLLAVFAIANAELSLVFALLQHYVLDELATLPFIVNCNLPDIGLFAPGVVATAASLCVLVLAFVAVFVRASHHIEVEATVFETEPLRDSDDNHDALNRSDKVKAVYRSGQAAALSTAAKVDSRELRRLRAAQSL